MHKDWYALKFISLLHPSMICRWIHAFLLYALFITMPILFQRKSIDTLLEANLYLWTNFVERMYIYRREKHTLSVCFCFLYEGIIYFPLLWELACKWSRYWVLSDMKCLSICLILFPGESTLEINMKGDFRGHTPSDRSIKPWVMPCRRGRRNYPTETK